MRDFNECIRKINCIEPSSSGNLFSWTATRGLEEMRKSRIDRGLVNEKWVDLYPTIQIQVLQPGVSDHCPLKFNWERKEKLKRPFKFFDFWMNDKEFKNILTES